MVLPWVYGLFLSLTGGKMGLQKAILEGKLAPSQCSKWKKARAAVRRRNIYYCGNDTSTQFFTASVAEELLLNTELTEGSKNRAIHLLKEFGLYEYRDAHPSTLSGGQKQRLAIACAVFSGRRILILDESTSGLDGQNMRLIAERLKSEARSGRTILVTTHDRELIESCCDNIVEVEKQSS